MWLAMLGSRRRLRLMLFLGVGLSLLGFSLVAYATDVFGGTERDTIDARFSIRGTEDPNPGVVVVAIDDVTFGDLKRRWPFPRSFHAQVVDRLTAAGAKVIAYDVQFTEPTSPKEDNALIDSVDRAHRVVLATTEVNEKGESNIFGGEDVLRDIGARSGNASYRTDAGGVIRRMPYETDKLENFAVVAAELARGERVDPRDFDHGKAWIDFAGPPGTFPTFSFSRVYDGNVPKDFFRGKVVVVGPSAPSLQDVHSTSVGGGDLMSGAEVEANAIATVLDDFPLRDTSGPVNVLLIVLLGMIGPAAGIALGPLRAALIGVLAAGAFAVAVQLLFNAGEIVPFVYPMIALVLGVIGALGVGLVVGAFERERVRDLFSRFVPEAVVNEVLADLGDDLRLGGTSRTVTVLFSDIRGFTTFSETRPPDQVIEILNRYLTIMTDVIHDHGGTLVSYMGDGIMAVFGAPIEQADHADRALAAAREMAGPALERFNEWAREQGVEAGFRIGIGLNSGPVMAGNVGSERRMEYTTIGDTTNTASRLEGMTKGTAHMIYLADSTRDMLTDGSDGLIRVDEMPVRGRAGRITVWSV
jgi:adenylate cyclase